MATYKESIGTAVTNYAGTYAGAAEGEVWYDSTNNIFKMNLGALAAASWSTKASLNTARLKLAGIGTTSAALAVGGNTEPPTQYQAITEQWNGSAWTETGDLNTARNALAASSYAPMTTAIVFGGGNPGETPSIKNNSEKWNGTNWTNSDTMLNGRKELMGAGNSNGNALAWGGEGDPPIGQVTLTEQYNGSSWYEYNDLPSPPQAFGAGAGESYTAALSFGAYNTGYVYQWNGTNWTTMNDMNTNTYSGGGSGTSTSAVAMGAIGGNNITETWNGTNWSVANTMNTGRYRLGAGGVSNTSSLAFGGFAPGQTGATEEFAQIGGPVTLTTS
jgi:hypothetical protein